MYSYYQFPVILIKPCSTFHVTTSFFPRFMNFETLTFARVSSLLSMHWNYELKTHCSGGGTSDQTAEGNEPPSLNLSLEHRSGVRKCIPLELSPPPCLTIDRLILLKTQYRHLQLLYLSCDLVKSWHLSILGPLQSFHPFFCNVPWALERIMRTSSLGPSNHLFLVLSTIYSHELLPLPMFTRNRGISL